MPGDLERLPTAASPAAPGAGPAALAAELLGRMRTASGPPTPGRSEDIGANMEQRPVRAPPVIMSPTDSRQPNTAAAGSVRCSQPQVDLGVEPGINPDSHPWADATDRAPEAR